MTWTPENIGASAQRVIEDRAASDARDVARRIWQEGMVGTRLEPVAITATYDFIAALKQESTAIPRWAWVTQEAMQQFIQQTGDRYYFAFLHVLCVTIGRAIAQFHAIPPSRDVDAPLPPVQQTAQRGRHKRS